MASCYYKKITVKESFFLVAQIVEFLSKKHIPSTAIVTLRWCFTFKLISSIEWFSNLRTVFYDFSLQWWVIWPLYYGSSNRPLLCYLNIQRSIQINRLLFFMARPPRSTKLQLFYFLSSQTCKSANWTHAVFCFKDLWYKLLLFCHGLTFLSGICICTADDFPSIGGHLDCCGT